MEFTFENLNQLLLLLNSLSITSMTLSDSLSARMPAAERCRVEKSLAAVKDLVSRLSQTQIGGSTVAKTLSLTLSADDMSIIRFSLGHDIAAIKEELVNGVEDMEDLSTERSKKYTSASFDDASDELKCLTEFYTSNTKKFSQLTALLTALNVSAQSAGMTVENSF